MVSSGVEAIGQSGGYYTDEEYTNWSDLASRNPELIKASMIAAGGLSGGLSSSIAGGSFWAGARQGLISSGLNHVAHMAEIGIENTTETKGLKKFIAIVVGESSDNILEAEGIGDVMLNRLEHVGENLTNENFINKIGGKRDFDAIGGNDYNKIMNMTLRSVLNVKSGENYFLRIQGAVNSINNHGSSFKGISKGAFFWNATSQQYNKNIGFNFRQLKNGTYASTTVIGETTFFKYSNSKKHWP